MVTLTFAKQFSVDRKRASESNKEKAKQVSFVF